VGDKPEVSLRVIVASRPPALADLFIASSDRKDDDVDPEAFIDYYEHNQVPLVLSLTTAPSVYEGANYVVRGDEFNREGDTIGFDVTELVFDGGAGFLEWIDDLSVDGPPGTRRDFSTVTGSSTSADGSRTGHPMKMTPSRSWTQRNFRRLAGL
jgi:hypothetical protein